MRTRLALALLALFIAASPDVKRLSAQAIQAPGIGPGVATIWYLGRCGYAVKTARHLLLFDYIELEGTALERGLSKGFVDPAEIAGLDVRVFVSHSHLDHYDPVILDARRSPSGPGGWRRAGPRVPESPSEPEVRPCPAARRFRAATPLSIKTRQRAGQ